MQKTPKFKQGDKLYINQDPVTIKSLRYSIGLNGEWQIFYRILETPNEYQERMFSDVPKGFRGVDESKRPGTTQEETDKYIQLTKKELGVMYIDLTGDLPDRNLKKEELLSLVQELVAAKEAADAFNNAKSPLIPDEE